MARVTIVLELDDSMDSPSGSARLADGTTRRFHGWLGLAEAIDALAQTDASATADEPAAGDARP